MSNLLARKAFVITGLSVMYQSPTMTLATVPIKPALSGSLGSTRTSAPMYFIIDAWAKVVGGTRPAGGAGAGVNISTSAINTGSAIDTLGTLRLFGWEGSAI